MIVIGSQWRHKKRGSICVVLTADEQSVTFQFPNEIRNPVRGKGLLAVTAFLANFEVLL